MWSVWSKHSSQHSWRFFVEWNHLNWKQGVQWLPFLQRIPPRWCWTKELGQSKLHSFFALISALKKAMIQIKKHRDSDDNDLIRDRDLKTTRATVWKHWKWNKVSHVGSAHKVTTWLNEIAQDSNEWKHSLSWPLVWKTLKRGSLPILKTTGLDKTWQTWIHVHFFKPDDNCLRIKKHTQVHHAIFDPVSLWQKDD